MSDAGINYTLFLDQRCNSYCIFCGHRLIDAATRTARAKAGLNVIQGETAFGQSYPRFHQRYDLEAAVADLRDARARGVTDVSIQGGEPTLWPQLPALLKRVQDLDFALVGMVSNGRRLANLEFCAELLESGLKHLSLSFLGATAETHDALSLVPGSFDEAMEGLRNLQRLQAKRSYGLVLNVNFIVSRTSAPELPIAVERFSELGVDAIQAHLVQFGGLASDPAVIERVAFDIRGASAPLREAIALARQKGIALHLQDLPPCLHPELSRDALRGIANAMRRRPHAFGGPAQSFKPIRHAKHRIPASCRGCWFEEDCARLPEQYLPDGDQGAFEALNDESIQPRIDRQLLEGAAPSLAAELKRLEEALAAVELLAELIGPTSGLLQSQTKIRAAIFGLLKAAARNQDYAEVYTAFRLIVGISSPRDVSDGQVAAALRARPEAPAGETGCQITFGAGSIAIGGARAEGDELMVEGQLTARVASRGPALLRALQDEFLCAPLRHAQRLRVVESRVEVFEAGRWRVAWALREAEHLKLDV